MRNLLTYNGFYRLQSNKNHQLNISFKLDLHYVLHPNYITFVNTVYVLYGLWHPLMYEYLARCEVVNCGVIFFVVPLNFGRHFYVRLAIFCCTFSRRFESLLPNKPMSGHLRDKGGTHLKDMPKCAYLIPCFQEFK